jgi:D-glycero-alpha-D-manno-heptose-7-phosphate kinase
MPSGASTGTSGAISVAIIGGLDALTEGRLSVAEMARLAHEVETVKLRQQGGIQDQLASAYGGINYIEMHQYPYATVSPIEIPEYVWWELEHRLLLVYIGMPHNSSKVHQKVIEKLGADASENAWFHSLRRLAGEAKNALFAGDFPGLGRIMNENTAIQRCLHKDLVSELLEDVISICGDFGALGCKVNGAGGDGGTVTVLTDRDMAKKRLLIKTLNEKGYQIIPISLARHGIRVW